MRLELKVAGDPFNAATERQLLTAIAVDCRVRCLEVRSARASNSQHLPSSKCARLPRQHAL